MPASGRRESDTHLCAPNTPTQARTKNGVKVRSSGSTQTQMEIDTFLPLASCVVFNKPRHLPAPQLPHLHKHQKITALTSWACCRDGLKLSPQLAAQCLVQVGLEPP